MVPDLIPIFYVDRGQKNLECLRSFTLSLIDVIFICIL